MAARATDRLVHDDGVLPAARALSVFIVPILVRAFVGRVLRADGTAEPVTARNRPLHLDRFQTIGQTADHAHGTRPRAPVA